MEAKYKITIPKPCHEDWDAMAPERNGRFCSSCTKVVVDFTKMKTTEIQSYFIENQGKNICGRFKTEQLDSIIIRIPQQVLFSQVQFQKIFMLALLVSMGTTLFSCQNNNGDKQKIDGVEVVDSIRKTRTMGMPIPDKTVELKTENKNVKKKIIPQKTTLEIQQKDTIIYEETVTSGLITPILFKDSINKGN
ncbi:hypothetical protein OX283_005815 [Flavobacterium sp. SUN052]|uniref:hypothetical protein n=1 Tax=Flavobacterium sp. SUN052 TaxID=3002441 RepID=UPI00237E25B1|nr:hypothetical protein [Flavobacterium sp. SUN052]MEC4004163.1 hypothetical protein [Flavobacterium sp. SUN052]